MLTSILEVLDHSLSYRLLAIFYYIQFLSYILTFNSNTYPIFPNPLYLLIITLIQFLLTIIAQVKDTNNQSIFELGKRHLFAIIPPFLAAKTIRAVSKGEKVPENNAMYIMSYRILFIIFLIFGGVFLILILGIIIFVKDTRIWFLMYSSSLGLIGISLGDWVVNDQNDNRKYLLLGNFNIKIFINFISKTLARRIIVLLLSVILIMVFIVLNLHEVFPILVT